MSVPPPNPDSHQATTSETEGHEMSSLQPSDPARVPLPQSLDGAAESAPSQKTSPNTRQASSSTAVAPSSEQHAATDAAERPAVQITLLLSTSARHPYRIDQRYLQSRNVEVEDGDPFNLTVFEMKELILRDWRSEWESRPQAASFIRLIYMGGLLKDGERLRDCRMSPTAPNVVHMTIKPADPVGDDGDDPKSTSLSHRDPGSSSRAGCCGGCVIL